MKAWKKYAALVLIAAMVVLAVSCTDNVDSDGTKENASGSDSVATSSAGESGSLPESTAPTSSGSTYEDDPSDPGKNDIFDDL